MDINNVLSQKKVKEIGFCLDGTIIRFGGDYNDQLFDYSDEKHPVAVSGVVYKLYENGNLIYYTNYENGIKNGEAYHLMRMAK